MLPLGFQSSVMDVTPGKGSSRMSPTQPPSSESQSSLAQRLSGSPPEPLQLGPTRTIKSFESRVVSVRETESTPPRVRGQTARCARSSRTGCLRSQRGDDVLGLLHSHRLGSPMSQVRSRIPRRSACSDRRTLETTAPPCSERVTMR
jgi:hypothetical protein